MGAEDASRPDALHLRCGAEQEQSVRRERFETVDPTNEFRGADGRYLLGGTAAERLELCGAERLQGLRS